MIGSILPGVTFSTYTPALAWILFVVDRDFELLTITSGSEGIHAEHSAHYRGEAIDVRSHDLVTLDAKRARQHRLANALGADFTVLLEPIDVEGSTAAEHLHVQLRAGYPYSAGDFYTDVCHELTTPRPGATPARPV